MSKINTNIVDYLSRIESLTNTNLQILKTINDSFFTKKSHLYTEIDDSTYVFPSFISLENKINMLQENFENLVKSPETSEAYFNFDGNTRSIEVRKYNYAPDSIELPLISNYNVEGNDIFKDFLTPVPYINLDLPYLPNDIVEINVKKIIAKSNDLKNAFKTKLSYNVEEKNDDTTTIKTLYNQSVNDKYSNIYKLLANYKEDYDYVEYDTIYKIPVRKNIGNGTYVITNVISDTIDDNLNEFITLKIADKLTYKLFDETIEKPLQIGDMLINYDGTGKVVITDIKPSANTITVQVVNGEYLNFLGTDSYDTHNNTDIHDLSKLRFYSSVDFDANKYIKVPLEEDQYIFIAAAPLNSRMNIQSSWGTGLIIDTYSLKNGDTSFKTYYDSNVKNIGDVLFEMTSMVTSTITSLSQDTFEKISSIKPNIKQDTLSVMQINKHLNNSTTVKNIRDAYNHKKTAESKLNVVQEKINDINTKLSSISFDDTLGTRTIYTNQLNSLNAEKNNLLADINSAINTISMNYNSAETPIENAKYRIRGFYIPTFNNIDNINLNNHVIGIQVQYRYKNTSSKLGNATTINSVDGNSTYIFSDWNVLNTFNKAKIAKCVDGIYSYEYEGNNENKNEPSYNQIDIPISQGESVDVRIKTVYDFGQPYITVTSDWSDIVNITFPEEFTKDIPVLTIIEENNNDIETNRFKGILETSGINNHITDSIIDQNITYYHKPDNIASGFYTEERRIIPLKDKLLSMSNDIAVLKSDIIGSSNNFRVSVSIGDDNIIIYSDRDNVINLESYNNLLTDNYPNGYEVGDWDLDNENFDNNDGSYIINNGVISTTINLSICNTGDTSMKLYSLFPGNRDVLINNSSSTFVNKFNYCNGTDEGVWFKYQYGSNESKLQSQNQFITFRIKDAWTGNTYYKSDVTVNTKNVQDSKNIDSISLSDGLGMVLYPYVSTKYGLCIDSDDVRSYIVINPGEEIIIPFICSYVATTPNSSIEKTISFDLRTSLYNDPINYSFKVVGKNTTTIQDKLTIINKKRFWNRLINPIKYNLTIK